MKLTTKTTYGMRAIAAIAKRNGRSPVSASVISKEEGISLTYLEQLLNKLKKNNIIKSIRGPKGGYVLAKDAVDISVYDIVKVLEGDVSLVFCLDHRKSKNKCGRKEQCVTQFLWKKLNESVKDTLAELSVKDLCSRKIL